MDVPLHKYWGDMSPLSHRDRRPWKQYTAKIANSPLFQNDDHLLQMQTPTVLGKNSLCIEHLSLRQLL